MDGMAIDRLRKIVSAQAELIDGAQVYSFVLRDDVGIYLVNVKTGDAKSDRHWVYKVNLPLERVELQEQCTNREMVERLAHEYDLQNSPHMDEAIQERVDKMASAHQNECPVCYELMASRSPCFQCCRSICAGCFAAWASVCGTPTCVICRSPMRVPPRATV